MSAKVEGELGLKITGFQSALKNAGKLMKEFGEHAKETAQQAAEQLRDITKETGTGKVGNMLGLAGGAAVVTTFVASVVETVKKGSEAFENFETSALQLGTLIGDKKIGNELEEWVHSIAGAGGKVEDLTAGLKQFIEAGLGIEESKTKLLEFQKIAIGTGDSVEELAAAYRKAKAGGLDAGEGANRFLKTGDMLRMATDEKNKGLTEKKQAAQGAVDLNTVQYGMNSPEVAKSKEVLAGIDAQLKETTADWVKKGNLTAKALDDMLARATGPGGKYEHAVDDAKGTQAGKKADLAEAFDADLVKLGEAMSHGLKPALDDLTAQMPKLQGYFVALGNATSGAIRVLEAMGAMTKRAEQGVETAGGEVYKWLYDLKHGGLGSGAYDALTQHPGANALQPGQKIVSMEKLEEHAAAQREALQQIAEQLKSLTSGGV